MFENWESLKAVVLGVLPNIAAALGILVVGWIVASLVARGVRSALARTRLDDRVAGWLADRNPDSRPDVGNVVARGVFAVLMLLVALAVFQALKLTIVTQPVNSLLTQLFEFAPRLLGATVLLLVAWVLATLARKVVAGALSLTSIDTKLGTELDESGRRSLASSIGEVAYWLVFLLFLPAILGALQLVGILEPVQAMLDRALGFLPNIFAAGLIFLVGWFVARIVRRITTSLASAAGVDRLGERLGLPANDESRRLSGILGLVVYVLVLFPVLISALDALALEAVTAPASAMLGILLDAVPNVLAASVIILLAVAIGRLLARLVASLLEAAGFDNLLARIGLLADDARSRAAASGIAGKIVLTATVLFAAMEGADLLGFAMISELLAQFLVFGGHLLVGVAILGIGLALANLASSALRAGGTASGTLLGRLAWGAIVTLSAAMGLRHMGLANEIIQLAFGLLLGAVAVAVAIAFGIGGRAVAGEYLARWTRGSLGTDSGAGRRRVEAQPGPRDPA